MGGGGGGWPEQNKSCKAERLEKKFLQRINAKKKVPIDVKNVPANQME